MNQADIIIIGAGASGLMAGRELGKAGKKVIILEARDRIGGRIWPLSEEEFGYLAQGGAEFVHGEASVTKSLIAEAGLTYVSMKYGEMWSVRDGEPVKNGGPTEDQDYVMYQDAINEKLKGLKEDMSVATFLDKYFGEEKYANIRKSVTRMAEDYDAADPNKISTFALREEWLGGEEWQQGKIKEGYGALLDFMTAGCNKNGVEIKLNKKVENIEIKGNKVKIRCENREIYEAQKVVITVSLPLISKINFNPAISEKIASAEKIGFGDVIKIFLKFKDRWWENALGKDLSKMTFIISNEKVTPWWTQYPLKESVLTGWIAGLKAREFENISEKDILEMSLNCLARTFKVERNFIDKELVNSKVINWPIDPFSLGAYSYSTIETKEAYAELRKPIENKIFFAGEALCLGNETATVEGALASGKEVVEKILKMPE